jgi:hypothetical protein
MIMLTFDHETAWTEVAKPAFDALPPAVHALFDRVQRETANFVQESGLGRSPGVPLMPWPEGDLRAAFDAFPDEELSAAARIIHDYGHWGHGAEAARIQRHGAHWKFSHYADQVLRARFNLPAADAPLGISLRIIDGLVRVCIHTPDSWQWQEVGQATRATFIALDARTGRPTDPRGSGSSKFVTRDQWDAFATAALTWATCTRAELSVNLDPALAKLLDTRRYMVEDTVLKARDKERRDRQAEAQARALDPELLPKLLVAVNAIAHALPIREAGRVLYQLMLEVRLTTQTRAELLDTLTLGHPELLERFRKEYEPHLTRVS